MVRNIIKAEGLLVLVVSIFFYYKLQGNWIIFALFIFMPDIFMIGYLKNKSLGALIYNLGHNYLLALLSLSIGYFINHSLLISLGLILSAHVGMDRFFGFGLKYPDSFKDTHIQKL
jgi:hypothetical protein